MKLNESEYKKLAQDLLLDLFPICRSLTGEGNRKTISRLRDVIPLNVSEISSGTKVYDWTIPEEWNIRDAFVKNSSGERVIDFNKNNLHVVNYSEPIRLKISYAELKSKIHTLPQMPKAIPYRTSYFKRSWGFCMSHEEFLKLDVNDTYEVVIDSSLANGSMTLSDAVHRGVSSKEILISTYCCHPSMANDNLSGVIVATLLFKYLSEQKTNYTYRLAIVPETLGVIAYLNQNEEAFENVIGGTVISTAAGRGTLGLKQSFLGNSLMDIAARAALNKSGEKWIDYRFVPDGSDERQYSSPGFRIPTVSITKDKYYEYPEYHTSLDNLDFVTPENIIKTLKVYMDWFYNLEMNLTFTRSETHCEFQLGKRGLYPNLGGAINQGASASVEFATDLDVVTAKDLEAFSWLMFGCDGRTDLIEISNKSKMALESLYFAALKMERAGLLLR